MKPKPTGKPLIAGPAQERRGYEDQAKMKRPIGIAQQEIIIGMRRTSAGGWPLYFADILR